MGYPGRDAGTEARDSSNMIDYDHGFVPTTVQDEYDNNGWLNTTHPVGSSQLNPLITAGMRGMEETSINPSAPQQRRTMMHSTGTAFAQFDSSGDGGDDGGGD